MDTKSIGIDKESIPEETPEKKSPMDRESTGMDSKCPEVWTPGVHIIVTKPSENPDSDADAHEADALDGDFEVGEPEQHSLPDDDHAPDVQPGIFGSHLLRDCHPYLYWFLRDMESRAARNPEALGDFAERLVMFGLQGSYCQASLNNFFRARKVCLDNQLLARAREDGFVQSDLVNNWPERQAEYIAEADECLEEFREYLANQAA